MTNSERKTEELPEFHPSLPDFYSGPAFILRRSQQLLTSYFNAECRTAGLKLSESQFGALSLLAVCASPPDQTELAQYLGSDRSTVSTIVNKLVKVGLVKRIVGRDRRRRALQLSPDAPTVIAQAQECIGKADEQFFAYVTQHERHTVHQLLENIASNPPARTPALVQMDGIEDDSLYRQTHFQLRRCTQVMVAGVAQSLSDAIVKSGMQLIVLYIVAACEPVDQATLSKVLWIDKSSLSLMLASLEADGFITRAPDKNDKRRLLSSATQSGKSALESGVERGREVDDSLFRSQPPGTQDEFVKVLGGLIRRLDAQRGIS